MFIGHYAVALASKKIAPGTSLGTAFMAAQFLDLLWPVFLLLGWERFVINPDARAVIPFEFTFYPYSHSLLFAVIWSVIFGSIYYLISKNRKGGFIMGLLVLSHWILDLIVHIPDLPLTPFTNTKLGFGVWNNKMLSLIIELVLFLIGIIIYLSSTKPINKTGKWATYSLLAFLFVLFIMNAFGPTPQSTKAVAWGALSQWILIFWAYWADKNRAPQ